LGKYDIWFHHLCYIKRFHFKSLGLELQAASSSELMDLHNNTVSAAAAAAAGWLGFCPEVEIQGFCQLEKPVFQPTVTGCWYSHNSTSVLPEGGGCSVCIPHLW
jgi:hypothetical protein